MTTDDALRLVNERIDPSWVLDLHRIIPLGGMEVPEHQRGGWKAVIWKPLDQSRTTVSGWGKTPWQAATALYEALG